MNKKSKSAIAPVQSEPVGVEKTQSASINSQVAIATNLQLPANNGWKEHSVPLLNKQVQDAVSFHKSELTATNTRACGSGEVVAFKYKMPKITDYNKKQRRLLAIAQSAINLYRNLNLPTE